MQCADALVFARAIDPAHAVRLIELGAVDVIPEAVEASLQLGARVLEGLGLSDDAVARRLDELREQELARLEARAGVAVRVAASNPQRVSEPLRRKT